MKQCFKESFIKNFEKQRMRKKIISLFRSISKLIPKNKKLILAYVDYEKVNGEFVPYKSDNVYLLTQYIQAKQNDINIYFTPSSQFGSKLNRGFGLRKKVQLIYKLLRAKIILTKMPLHSPSYFLTKEQCQIALGYFIPFKSDYFELKDWQTFYSHIMLEERDKEKCDRFKQVVLEYFVYESKQFDRTNLTFITSSKYMSDVISRSHNISRKYFKELGSPKSDYSMSKQLDIVEMFNLDKKPSKVILYTPTFRDDIMRLSIDDLKENRKNIFGYVDEIKILEPFLKEKNIVIIIKLHKSFLLYRELETYLKKDDESYFENCYFLDFETESKYGISIYDLFELSDAMIADYSSISFDYLPYDKPIIYNIPDIEEYRAYRGFSYEPIEELMVGETVENIKELISSMNNIVNGYDTYREERTRVCSFVNEVPKGKSLENIYNYIMEILQK